MGLEPTSRKVRSAVRYQKNPWIQQSTFKIFVHEKKSLFIYFLCYPVLRDMKKTPQNFNKPEHQRHKLMIFIACQSLAKLGLDALLLCHPGVPGIPVCTCVTCIMHVHPMEEGAGSIGSTQPWASLLQGPDCFSS